MTFARRGSGANTTLATGKRRAAGAWVTGQSLKRRVAGAWTTIWTAISATLTDKLTAALSSTAVPPVPYYEINADGKVYTGNLQTGINTHTLYETWKDSVNPASAYQVRATKVSGGTLASGTLGTWLACSTTQQWSMQDGTRGDGASASITLLIEIRDATSGLVLASCQSTITSTWNSGGTG